MLAAVLVLCFVQPLYELVRFALNSDLYSHIVLIPFVSLYLVWQQRGGLALDGAPVRRLAVAPLLAGSGILAGYQLGTMSGWQPEREDYLAAMTLAFLALGLGGALLLFGPRTLRVAAWPAAFLIFMVPFPVAVEGWITRFLQQGSAEIAHGLLKLSGMPVFREDLVLHLPGFSMEVAPQCSGIHSSLVLFITSLLAGCLFLRSPWRRAVLALATIPLGLLRNGVRIVTIAELCVHVSPDMIDSPIHRHGGPVFFALSLIPLLLLLLWFRGSERRKQSSA